MEQKSDTLVLLHPKDGAPQGRPKSNSLLLGYVEKYGPEIENKTKNILGPLYVSPTDVQRQLGIRYPKAHYNALLELLEKFPDDILSLMAQKKFLLCPGPPEPLSVEHLSERFPERCTIVATQAHYGFEEERSIHPWEGSIVGPGWIGIQLKEMSGAKVDAPYSPDPALIMWALLLSVARSSLGRKKNIFFGSNRTNPGGTFRTCVSIMDNTVLLSNQGTQEEVKIPSTVAFQFGQQMTS